MAREGAGGGGGRQEKAGDPPRQPTERVILRRVRGLALPEEFQITPEQQKEVAKALGLKVSDVPFVEAWQEVSRETGDDKRDAIEAYAGEPNTPTAKPGTYKAPTASAWKGGRQYDRPPEPKVEAKDIE